MTLPQQIEEVPEEREAYAPYNFVPLPEKVVSAELPLPDHNRYYPPGERHTGRIACALTTATPLYVRCGYTPEEYAAFGDKAFHELRPEEKQRRAQFFHHNDPQRPVIPGSSLRGMLRALVEIAGYGKMEKVTDRPRYFFRAVAAKTDDPLADPYRSLLPSVRAGYLVQRADAWAIRPAELDELPGESFLKVRETDIQSSVGLIRMNDQNYRPQYIQVSFSYKRTPKGRYVADRIDKPGVLSYAGVLVTSGNMIETGAANAYSNRKNHCVVLPASSREIPIAEEAISSYRAGLTSFQQGPTDIEPASVRPFSENMGMLKDGRPVFYCEPQRSEREVRFFGHSPNFRLPFWRSDKRRTATPADFVPEYLISPAGIDLAEAIFGVVRPRKQEQGSMQAIAGRVFVSDGLFAGARDGVWLNEQPVMPHILGSPKPTTFQHYLVQTQADRVEVGTDRRGQPIYKLPLTHYGSKTPEETVVRGHKLYWHRGNVGEATIRETNEQKICEAPKQYTQFKPVKEGVSFVFTIRFENLSDVELGALLWVLSIAADERYRLKLGMGKPLGMGAVAITHEVWLSDRVARYRRLLDGEGWASGERAMRLDEEGDCVNAFGQYVLKESGEAAKGNTRLSNTLRIRCLLALLSWPGPNPKATRYMEIERDAQHPDGIRPVPRINNGKGNEYSNRLVLPTPKQVMEKHGPRQNTPRRPDQPMSLPKPGNDRQGKITAREGGVWVVELEGGFVVRASLPRNMQRPAIGDRVVVRITGKGDTGEMRKLLPS